MIDALLQYVVEELGMCGPEGTSHTKLGGLIKSYYRIHSHETYAQQVLDDTFIRFVWRNLVGLPEVRIGTLQPIEDQPAEVQAQAKGKGVLQRDARIKPSNAIFVDLPTNGGSVPLQDLVEQYGNKLRLGVDQETCWHTLTGSHHKPNTLTRLVYDVLISIAQGREKGKTMIDLKNEFTHDSKSLFHFTRTIARLGLAVKFKATQGAATHRLIHRRYLDQSDDWQALIARDPTEALGLADEEMDDGAASDAEPSLRPLQVTPIDEVHFENNPQMIRNRIISVLQHAPSNIVPHAEVLRMIGFGTIGRLFRRKFNTFVSNMCDEGVIEKVAMKTQRETLQPCLRLGSVPASQEPQGDAGADAVDSTLSSSPFFNVTIERQVVDNLTQIHSNGLTTRDMSQQLADLPIRTLESIMARLRRDRDIPHLGFFSAEVAERVGKERRIRYYTQAGLRQRCLLDGVSLAGMNMPEADTAVQQEPCLFETAGYYNTLEEYDEYVGNLPSTIQDTIPSKKDSSVRRDLSVRSKYTLDGNASVNKPEGSKGAKGKSGKGQSRPKARPEKPIELPKAQPDRFPAAKSSVKAGPSEKGKGKARSIIVVDVPSLMPETLNALNRAPKKRKRPPEEVDPDKPRGRPKKLPGDEKSPYTRKVNADGTPVNPKPHEKILMAQGIRPVITDIPSRPRKRRKLKDAADSAASSSTAARKSGRKSTSGPSTSALVTNISDEEEDEADMGTEHDPQETTRTGSQPHRPSNAEVVIVAETSNRSHGPAEVIITTGDDTREPPEDQSDSDVILEVQPTNSGADAIQAAALPSTEPFKRGRGRPRKHDVTRIDAPYPLPNAPTVPTKRAAPIVIGSPSKRARTADQPNSSQASPAKTKSGKVLKKSAPIARPSPTVHIQERPIRKLTKKEREKTTQDPNVYTALMRENDLEAYLNHAQGIFLVGQHIGLAIHQMKTTGNPFATKGHILDKRTVNLALGGLERRGIGKRITVTLGGTGGSIQRKDIFHRAGIDANGEQMKMFITALYQEGPAGKSLLGRFKEVIKDKKPPVASTSKAPVDPERVIAKTPLVAISDEEMRTTFIKEWRIISQYYGYLYGRMSRARLLHHLIRRLTASAEKMGSPVFTPSDFINSLSIGEFFQLVPLFAMDPEVCAYLDIPENGQTKLHDLPVSIFDAAEPHSRNRRRKLQMLFDLLRKLSIITPMSVSTQATTHWTPGSTQQPVYFVSDQSERSTHWLLNRVLPVYHFAAKDEEKKLVSVITTSVAKDIDTFWNSQQRCSFPPRDTEKAPAYQDDARFPSLAPSAELAALVDEITSPAKWQTDYVLLKEQKNWINSQLTPATDREDPSLAKRLSHATVTPLSAIETYLRHLPKKLRRRGRPRKAVPSLVSQTVPESASETIARKADAANEQREKDYQAIVNRFFAMHKDVKIDDDTLKYLHDWFMNPSGTVNLTARDLEHHLNRFAQAPNVQQEMLSQLNVHVQPRIAPLAPAKSAAPAAPAQAPSLVKVPRGPGRPRGIGQKSTHFAIPNLDSEDSNDPTKDLPDNPIALVQNWKTQNTDHKPHSQRWDFIWQQTSATGRLTSAANMPFTHPLKRQPITTPTCEVDLGMAMAAIKSNIATTAANFDTEKASQLLKPFGSKPLQEAISRLSEAHVIRRIEQAESGKPSYEFTPHLNTFFKQSLLLEARSAEESLSCEDQLVWPIVIEDGAMLSLCHLVSAGKIQIDIDISYSDDLVMNDHYTRRGDDESVEHPVLLQGSSDALSFHPDWLTRAPTMMTARGIPNHTPVTHSQDSPSSSTLCLQSISSTDATGWTNCATCLNKSCNEVCASKSEEDHALVLKLLDVIYKAKGEGITVSHLLMAFSLAQRSSIIQITEACLAVQPPLVFWAGFDTSRLVSSTFLSVWTVSRTSTIERDGESVQAITRNRPCLWLDNNGNHMADRWQKALLTMSQAIMSSPNIDTNDLCNHGSPFLDRLEVTDILDHFLEDRVALWTPQEQDLGLPGYKWGKGHWRMVKDCGGY